VCSVVVSSPGLFGWLVGGSRLAQVRGVTQRFAKGPSERAASGGSRAGGDPARFDLSEKSA